MQPIFAVEGSPSLALAVQACGLSMVTSATAAADVADAVKALDDAAPVCVIVTSSTDDVVRAWVTAQVAHRRRVLMLGEHEPIRGAKSLPLPATVADILRVFRAPEQYLQSPAAQVEIGPDGHVPQDDADEESPSDDWDDWPEPTPMPAAAIVEDPDDWDTPAPAPAPVPLPVPAPAPAPVPTPVPVPVSTPAPEPVPVRVSRPMPAPVPDRPLFDESDFVDEDAYGRGGALGGEDLAPVIIVFSSKGGVAKSTTSIALAQRAAEVGHLPKVVLVDGNRGQGDARKYLRLSRGTLPTIYDAAISGRPETAVVGPTFIAKSREPSLPPIAFGLVMAPRDGQADPEIVTTRLYDDVLLAARRRAELVIVDTQIMEDHDTSGLWDGLWIPMLSSPGVWGLGLTDSSTPGVTNLLARLALLEGSGVRRDRLMVAMTRIPASTSLSTESVAQALSRYAHLTGVVHESPEISRGFELGRVPHAAAELREMLDEVLYRVTGLGQFEPASAPAGRARRRRFRLPLPGGRSDA